jgi:hypothetical protein
VWHPFAAAIVVLSATAGAAWAQSEGTIRGHVQATAGTTVALTSVPVGAPVQTKTDAAGRFAFQHVRPGEYVLSTVPDGFTIRHVRFVLKPREVRVVTLAVDIQGIGVAVEVTAPLVRTEGTHSPSSTILSAQRFESVPISQRVNLTDVLLTAAPGVVRADNDFVHVRGHEIGLSILINGVSFWENPLPGYSGGLSPRSSTLPM